MSRSNKCTHGQRGMCINCLINKQKQQPGTKCQHPSHMKCLKCAPYNPAENKEKCSHPDFQKCPKCQKQYNYDTFSSYLSWLQAQCAHKKPCKKCVPPLSRQNFRIDLSCKKHIPYPNGMCDSCMPPTLTIASQKYKHVEKVIIKTPLISKLSESKLFGVLLGKKIKGVITVQDIYFPCDQIEGNMYFNRESYERFDILFNWFQLEQVGIFYNSHIISGPALISAALCQQLYPECEEEYTISRFVSLRVQSFKQDTEPSIECYMASDMMQVLNRHGMVFQNNSSFDRFDLINSKSENMSDLPTFLREGIQTKHLLFKQAIVWIPTFPEEDYRQQSHYPLFTLESQTLDTMKQFIKRAQGSESPQKYLTNIQFLLHLWKIIGGQKVMLFLDQYLFACPFDFLDHNLKQTYSQQKSMLKRLQKLFSN